ncbi:MAG: 16S rRNA (cytidine(1402)-2'-O)-methyltransferase [Myxococcaceae bacterium]|nr:16S rRNA (cytidine(1402)-2'-O)-methyltransferase [Myxococcaceae bacterium]
MGSVGTLFLVATPIGNLGDVSARALTTLRQVAFVICEDTRRSRILLDAHGITVPLVSMPAFAEGERAHGLVRRIAAGEDAALVTDAGSPAVSDPGERLVAEALEAGLQVVAIPGPTALVAALSVSGLPTGRFHFLGFLPRAAGEARTMVEEVRPLSATLALYEAPGRVGATLALLHEVLGERRACVARELTKLHEEVVRGTLSELAGRYADAEVRGEVVLLVEGAARRERWSEAEVQKALREAIAAGARLKGLSQELADRSGWPAKELYRLGLALKPEP